MKIGILGAGNIGGTLGKRLAERGHTVVIGVRDPTSPKSQAAQVAGLTIVSMAEAVAQSDIVVVAVPLDAARDLLTALDLNDKIVIDTTNAFGGVPAGYASAGAAIADWSGSQRVAKAFNAAPWETIDNPIYEGSPVETYICGDDAEAKQVALQLAQELGFNAVDIGGLANATLSENFAKLWGTLAYQGGYGRGFAFKIVKR